MYIVFMDPSRPKAFVDCHYLALQHRWRDLSACASGIIPMQIPLEPAPGEIEMVADDLRVLARKVDALVEAYGDYIYANAPEIDLSMFKHVLFNAIDGNALYEIERAAQHLRDHNAERAYYARHNPVAAE